MGLGIGDILRRVALARSLPGVTGQAPDAGSGNLGGPVGPIPGQVSNYQPLPDDQALAVQPAPSLREKALSEYQQALGQPAPKLADYHPSVGRRIGAALLGGIAGMNNAKIGAEVGRGVAYASFDKEMADYQQKLAQKKAAFETAEKGEEGTAKIESEKERSLAEKERAGAEAARKRQLEYQVMHPELKGTKLGGPPLFKIGLTNGKTVVGEEKPDGSMVTTDGLVIDKDLIDATKTYRIGTEPKPGAGAKPAAPGSLADYVARYAKEKNIAVDDLTGEDLDKVYAQIAKDKETTALRQERLSGKTPQALMIGPDLKAIDVKPGTKVPKGSTTVGGLSSENVPTAPTRQMAEAAPKVVDLATRIRSLVDQQEKTLGPGSSRWRELMAGKIGEADPEFTKLRTNVKLLQTALMRMHIGARGGQEMMKHFQDLIDESKQSPENLRAALDEIVAYANTVSGKGEGIGGGGNTGTDPKDPLGILGGKK